VNKLKQLVTVVLSNASFILVLVAMTIFSYTGFLVNQLTGLVVTGVMLVLLAWILSPDLAGRQAK
jgi:hypothetical protein